MISVLKNTTYAKLLGAQVVALVGTGLLTVALGLLAYEIAGADAGAVLGVALTIKMVAYVVVSPMAAALTARLPRKPVLIAADILRAAVALALPFVDQAWQIYVLIFVLQSASATFTPTFQAVIPAVLPDERDYTKALSLSRLAYDLESLLSPVLAAALLTVISFHSLFYGTVVGFVGSAALVLATVIPPSHTEPPTPFRTRLVRGVRVFGRHPELRGLAALNVVVATATAVVLVNTVVMVQDIMGRPATDVALLLGAYGAGSMMVALAMPRLLETRQDRGPMLAGAFALPILLAVVAGAVGTVATEPLWWVLLTLWALMGAATSAILTPSARLLRRNSTEQNRPAVFAAQFSLSHACFLVMYPLAGGLGAAASQATAAGVLAAVGVVAALVAAILWRQPA